MDLTLHHEIEGDEVILRTCTRCSAPDPSLGDNNSRALISFLLPVISRRQSLSLKGHFRPGGSSSCALQRPQRTRRFYTVFTMHCVPTAQDVGMQGTETSADAREGFRWWTGDISCVFFKGASAKSCHVGFRRDMSEINRLQRVFLLWKKNPRSTTLDNWDSSRFIFIASNVVWCDITAKSPHLPAARWTTWRTGFVLHNPHRAPGCSS